MILVSFHWLTADKSSSLEINLLLYGLIFTLPLFYFFQEGIISITLQTNQYLYSDLVAFQDIKALHFKAVWIVFNPEIQSYCR